MISRFNNTHLLASKCLQISLHGTQCKGYNANNTNIKYHAYYTIYKIFAIQVMYTINYATGAVVLNNTFESVTHSSKQVHTAVDVEYVPRIIMQIIQ